MYARKLQAEIVIAAERRPMPLEWLDAFCMRNFTGSAEFDDTLPIADGRLEAGLRVDPQRLAHAMGEWFTKRGKGNGHAVAVEIVEIAKIEGRKEAGIKEAGTEERSAPKSGSEEKEPGPSHE